MRRYALLIGGDDLKSSSHAQGVEKDLVDFSQHLSSSRGGAWEADEMQLLVHPTRREVLSWLDTVRKIADYCTILYAGHGCHYANPLYETSLCLADKEEILVRELNPQTARQLVILDTCRKLTLVEAKELRMSREKMAFSGEVDNRAQLYRRSCRSIFDSALQASDEGRCIAYACDVNQTAGDNDQGGYFTQSMLTQATIYHGNASERYSATATQSLRDNFRLTSATVQLINAPQRPVLEEGRRITSLPFAVR